MRELDLRTEALSFMKFVRKKWLNLLAKLMISHPIIDRKLAVKSIGLLPIMSDIIPVGIGAKKWPNSG